VRWRLAAAAVVLVGASVFRSGPVSAATTQLFHANPVQLSVSLDYVNPLTLPNGQVAVLPQLEPSVIPAAEGDFRVLSYARHSDLGGFEVAPLHVSALTFPARTLIGTAIGTPQIAHYATAPGQTQSFGLVPGAPIPNFAPDNGSSPVPGLGTPTQVVPPVALPPAANQTFGAGPVLPPAAPGLPPQSFPGTGGPLPRGHQPGRVPTAVPPVTVPPTTIPGTPATTPTTHPPTTTIPPTSTTTPGSPTTTAGGGPTTTSPTTTTPTPTTPTTVGTSPPAAPPPTQPNGGSCGSGALVINGSREGCVIRVFNMYPGSGATELMTIQNESSQPFDLSVQVSGTPNRLWNDLNLNIWDARQTESDPNTWPRIGDWTTQHDVETLAVGQSIQVEVGVYLGPWAGNQDQNQSAVFDLTWRAQA
jgi:hypothetical protein